MSDGLAAAVHKTVHDALVAGSESDLAAYIAGRAYDRVPNPAPFPYLTIGTIEIIDDANSCSNASEVHVTVHVWSNAVGSIEAKRIGTIVRRILAPDDPTFLTFVGFHTIVAAFDAEIYRPAEQDLVIEGVLTFTYLVDPE